MRDKTQLLQDLGLTENYNPHAGIPPETKELIIIEVLIDIRDLMSAINARLKEIDETIYRFK